MFNRKANIFNIKLVIESNFIVFMSMKQIDIQHLINLSRNLQIINSLSLQYCIYNFCSMKQIIISTIIFYFNL